MAHKLETKSEEFDVEIKYTSGDVMLETHHYVTVFLHHLHIAHVAVPLSTFSLKEEPEGSKSFRYHIAAVDGREWLQTIKISSRDPEMNFDVPDFWRLSEFALQRPIRDDIVLFVLEHGVTEIEITFN